MTHKLVTREEVDKAIRGMNIVEKDRLLRVLFDWVNGYREVAINRYHPNCTTEKLGEMAKREECIDEEVARLLDKK